MTTVKRKALSLQDKVTILKLYDEQAKSKNQAQLAAELQLPVSTLRTILKKRKEIIDKCSSGGLKRKRYKVGKFDNLEKILVKWLLEAQASNEPVSGPIVCEKARKIAKSLNITDFNATPGWIDRFKRRHDIVYSQKSARSREKIEKDVDIWMETFPTLLENYEPRDTFNADEFSLYFKLMPDNTYILEDEPCHNEKGSKGRLTILACVNSDGSEKLRLLVIGKEKKPHCLKHVKSLPVTYDTQSRAYMTDICFTNWLKTLDDHFQVQGRHVALFIKSCSAHPEDIELNNIKLVFFPPNAKTKLNPMDRGIIKALKQGYRTRLVHRYLMGINDVERKRSLNVHEAILNIAAAWEEIKPEIIQYCFQKAGFRNNDAHIPNEDEEEPAILQNFPGYSSIDDNVSTYDENSRFEDVEDTNSIKNETLSDDNESDEEESTPNVSNAQALSAVGDLRRFVSCLDDSENALQMLNYIESLVITNASKCSSETNRTNFSNKEFIIP